MADNSRARSYLGLAKKAGKVRSGEFQTEEAVKKKLACLVILAADASDNTKKKFQSMCEFRRIPVFVYSDKTALGAAVGCAERSSLAVLDPGFAEVIIKALRQDADRERRY